MFGSFGRGQYEMRMYILYYRQMLFFCVARICDMCFMCNAVRSQMEAIAKTLFEDESSAGLLKNFAATWHVFLWKVF